MQSAFAISSRETISIVRMETSRFSFAGHSDIYPIWKLEELPLPYTLSLLHFFGDEVGVYRGYWESDETGKAAG